jgi:hypothetical protein
MSTSANQDPPPNAATHPADAPGEAQDAGSPQAQEINGSDSSSLAGDAMNLLSEHKGKLAIGVAATLGLMVYYGWREKRLAKTDPEEYALLQRLRAVMRKGDAPAPKPRGARKPAAGEAGAAENEDAQQERRGEGDAA